MLPQRRRVRLILSAAILAVGVVCLIFLRHRISAHDASNRAKCQNYLRAVASMIMLYRGENHGSSPPNLEVLAETQGISLEALTCPGATSNRWGAMPTTFPTDYLYIQWPTEREWPMVTATKRPLMYDSRLDHHGTRGIYIVLDGDRAVIWDQNAEWLNQFARQHPQLTIPMPQ
jgi:hypothetical protein